MGDTNPLSRRDLFRLVSAVTFGANPPTAYVAGEQMGALISFTDAARISGGSGVITSVVLTSYSDVVGAVDVVFFDSSVTLAADSAAFVLSADADVLKVVGMVSLAGAYDLGNQRIAQAYNLAIPYVLSGSTTLYAALIARSSATWVINRTTTNLAVMVERN